MQLNLFSKILSLLTEKKIGDIQINNQSFDVVKSRHSKSHRDGIPRQRNMTDNTLLSMVDKGLKTIPADDKVLKIKAEWNNKQVGIVVGNKNGKIIIVTIIISTTPAFKGQTDVIDVGSI